MSTGKGLTVSFSPHQKGDQEVTKIMWGVVIALVPAFAAAVYFYGIEALRVVTLTLIFCVGGEYLMQKFIMKTKVTAMDGSAAITGLLLAFNVPLGVPWWQLLAGALVAIGVAKLPFGGLGKNPFNPALVGRAFMLASFPVEMTTWAEPVKKFITMAPDAVSCATPLGILKEGLKKGDKLADVVKEMPSHLDLFWGQVSGCIGEISAVAILIGGLYMIYKKIITWHIPVVYLASLAGFTCIFWLMDKTADPLFHILAGGAMLGAWFMATDMVTSPMSIKGQVIFALFGGILCGAIRIFGSYPEGCSYSILIMNAFVPLIDKYVKPKRFGKEVNYG